MGVAVNNSVVRPRLADLAGAAGGRVQEVVRLVDGEDLGLADRLLLAARTELRRPAEQALGDGAEVDAALVGLPLPRALDRRRADDHGQVPPGPVLHSRSRTAPTGCVPMWAFPDPVASATKALPTVSMIHSARPAVTRSARRSRAQAIGTSSSRPG